MKTVNKTLILAIAIMLIGIISLTYIFIKLVILQPASVYEQTVYSILLLAYVFISIHLLGKHITKLINKNVSSYLVMDKPLCEIESDESDVIIAKPKKEKPKYKYRPKPKKTEEKPTPLPVVKRPVKPRPKVKRKGDKDNN